jgi:hypothetical protein
MTSTTRILADGIYFGEGPRWHDGRLWFSDFYAHAVKSVSLAGDLRTEFTIDDQPSGLGWMPDGSMLIVSMIKRQLLRRTADGVISRARRSVGPRHLPLQRHGRRQPGPRLCRQLRLQPRSRTRNARHRNRCSPTMSPPSSRWSQQTAACQRRRRRPAFPQRQRHHPRWPHAHRRRNARRRAHRIRHRPRRQPVEPPRLGADRTLPFPTASRLMPTAPSGSPTRSHRSACASPKAARCLK